MRKNESSKKSAKTETLRKEEKPAKSGPVELKPEDLKKVSGGLPKGGWLKSTQS
jgi:hypothetical protein